ncbi:MAG TPA: hypothetical protein VEB20_07010 [Azospirillaceae bacterium]|nr:hypothetical protein [Azospirillaceae bacterium]
MEVAQLLGQGPAARLIAEIAPAEVEVLHVGLEGELSSRRLPTPSVLAALREDCLPPGEDPPGGGRSPAPLRLIPETARRLPDEMADTSRLLLIAEAADAEGPACPRALLRGIAGQARQAGFVARAAFGYDFHLFDGGGPGFEGGLLRLPGALAQGRAWDVFRAALLRCCAELGVTLQELEALPGEGTVRARLAMAEAADAADQALLFRHAVRLLARRHGLAASFMAKLSDAVPGHGGPIRLALERPDGGFPFHDADAPDRMSLLFRRFVAGQVALMPDLLVMAAPTVNAYRRLLAGQGGARHACWSADAGAAAALAVLPGPEPAVEYRVTASDANPYLALSAALGSGLWGIEKEAALGPAEGEPGGRAPHAVLAPTLWDAAHRIRISEAAHDLFGTAFVEAYAARAEREIMEYRRHVTDWEVMRYFDRV